ncbi:MAG: hypothetical protein K2W99_02920 [Chthoniobacterales bacterium]|nr:hypothetical protein [Chthoniobacterales bacterium]
MALINYFPIARAVKSAVSYFTKQSSPSSTKKGSSSLTPATSSSSLSGRITPIEELNNRPSSHPRTSSPTLPIFTHYKGGTSSNDSRDSDSFFVHDPRRDTVTHYEGIGDGSFYWEGPKIRASSLRESSNTPPPISRSSISSKTSTSTRSVRSTSSPVAVKSQKIRIEDKTRFYEIVQTELNSLDEKDYEEINTFFKQYRPHVARFYVMGYFLNKLDESKYPELGSRTFREAVAGKMSDRLLEKSSGQSETTRSSPMRGITVASI